MWLMGGLRVEDGDEVIGGGLERETCTEGGRGWKGVGRVGGREWVKEWCPWWWFGQIWSC